MALVLKSAYTDVYADKLVVSSKDILTNEKTFMSFFLILPSCNVLFVEKWYVQRKTTEVSSYFACSTLITSAAFSVDIINLDLFFYFN